MKLSINGYEVEIKVKREYEKKASKDAAAAFLNTLSVFSGEAATRYLDIHMFALREEALSVSNDIYDALNAIGYYD